MSPVPTAALDDAGAIAAAALLGSPAAAQDWPQWRGPGRDGTVPAATALDDWTRSLHRLWRVEVGEGYSSPVMADGRAFVHGRRDPYEVVTAVELASGEIAWQRNYAAHFSQNRYAVERAKGPHATPLVAGGRLFTLGVTGVLSAWNPQTGDLLWRNDYSASVDTSKLFCGTAASPLVAGGALVVQIGSDVAGGRVITLDPATGAERWVWRGAGPGYASPVVIAPGGEAQIVTLTEGSVEGIDAATGAALWSVPFPDEWHENIVTPVWTGTHLVVSGPRRGTVALSLHRSDGRWRAAEAWANPEVTMYMSTPVFADGTLYGYSSKRKGQLVALDAATGAVRWATAGREGEHASVLLAPAHVLFLTNNAELVAARRLPARFEETARHPVADSETWAMPVPLADGLLVRDGGGLLRAAFGGGTPSPPVSAGDSDPASGTEPATETSAVKKSPPPG